MNNSDIQSVKEVWNNASHKFTTKGQSVEEQFQLIKQVAENFAPGSYYYFVVDFTNMNFDYVSEGVEKITGCKREEFNIETILSSVYHPDDLPAMQAKEATVGKFLFEHIDINDATEYKVSYVIRYKINGSIKKILHQSRAINTTDDGKIGKVLCIHTDVTHLSLVDDGTVSFISKANSHLPSYYQVNTTSPVFSIDSSDSNSIFSKSEIAVLKLLADGYSSQEIGVKLNLSEHTIKTHRKNTLKKSGTANSAELIAKCIREGVV